PGFLFAMGWTAMYEVYHEEGSYFTTLIQEVLGSEGLFPIFLLLVVLMSFPIGMAVDAVRYVVGEVWLGLPRRRSGRRGTPSLPDWLGDTGAPVAEIQRRLSLYRQARATLLTPARAAGNLGLVVLALTLWSAVKIFRMGGTDVFSLAFVIGMPLVGLGLGVVLLIRYAAGLGEFSRDVYGLLPSTKEPLPSPPAAEAAVLEAVPPGMPATARPPEGS
ncbi:MAG TPA: hypothetical protein VLH58_06515, partial [Candidatus Methylomirabilis sp.]|nr:hypothetical protein [Candidatus Methylomirabilis sp.]